MNISDTRKIVIIVDAYSSGNGLAPGFNQHGYRCAHIQSRSNLPRKLLNSYQADDFYINLQYANDDTLEQLESEQIIAVVAGSETGIELADRLAAVLKLPGNNSQSSLPAVINT